MTTHKERNPKKKIPLSPITCYRCTPPLPSLPVRPSSSLAPPLAASFHASSPGPVMGEQVIIRPRTVSNLLAGGRGMGSVATEERRPRLTKLLLNVTNQRSLGAMQVVMSPESNVGDLIVAALRQYAKEGQRMREQLNPRLLDVCSSIAVHIVAVHVSPE